MRPGTVYSSFNHEGEWTFSYFTESGDERWDELDNNGRTFISAAAAKRGMREFLNIPVPGEK